MSYEVKVGAAQIRAPHLKKDLFVEVHRADDAPNLAFVELQASHKLARMLCTDGHVTWDCFGCVTVLSVLKNLRDVAFREHSKRVKGRNAKAAVVASELAADNTYTTVSVPSIAGEPSRQVNVILTPIKTPVRMELSDTNLAWLSGVIAAERALGVKKRDAPTEKAVEMRQMRDADPMIGTKLWVSSGGVCRVIRPTDADTGKRAVTYVQTAHMDTAEVRSHAEAVAAGQVETPKRRKLTQTSLMTMFGSGTSSAGSSSFDSSSVADSDAP